MRWLLALPFVLASCSGDDPAARKQLLQERQAKREAKAQQVIERGPGVYTHQVERNQLLVLDVPVSEDGFVERQKCFVWRDAEYKSATMTCPSREVHLGSP
jgi:hypothetical protein